MATNNDPAKSIRLARVTERATKVFGDAERAAEWLNIPNTALGGQTPLSLLDTDIGSETVMDTLGRIEHGVFT